MTAAGHPDVQESSQPDPTLRPGLPPIQCRGGIQQALSNESRARYEQFFKQYLAVRHAEGRGSDDASYYLGLPFEAEGPIAWQWAMRSRTYRVFERRILDPLIDSSSRPLRVLDLGAGVGWLSYRMALKGCRPVAVDLLDDPLDGLGAARHYTAVLDEPFLAYQAEFDDLPFADAQFDLAVFNASFHYSTDYQRTLREVRRVLAWGGRVVILDTPVYRRFADGQRMTDERHADFERRFGFRSDSIASMEFLDHRMIGELARSLNLQWRIFKPWYGWRWHLRPLRAALRRKRSPSRFWILEGSWTA